MRSRAIEPFVVPLDVATETHLFLQAQGAKAKEGVVLWIGTFDPPTILRAVIPQQDAGAGRFRVPLQTRQRLARELAGTSHVLVAQVHSHPMLAFHSAIDDAEAIPRRVGAYSLVVPDFGSRAHLLEGSALYRLDEQGRWADAPLETFGVPDTSVATEVDEAISTRRRLWRRLTSTLRSFGRSRI